MMKVAVFLISLLVPSQLLNLVFIHAAPFRVVIDPGHGGNDHGTVHLENQIPIAEKDLTLGLALELEIELRNLKIETVLTRRTDSDLPLPARTQLANDLKADLFISLHLNSMNSVGSNALEASGIETYILNHTTDASSRRLAQLENKGLLVPDSVPLSEEPEVNLILKDLQLDSNLVKSRRLACQIQTALTQGGPPSRNRGIKEGLFYVLLGANMPAVLVEVGFLSHPKDRSYLLSFQGRQTVARRMAYAISQFKPKGPNQHKRIAQQQIRVNTCKIH